MALVDELENLTAAEAELAREIDQAADGLLDVAGRYSLCAAVNAMGLALLSTLRYLDRLNPPPKVKAFYEPLERELELFVTRNLNSLFHREEKNEEAIQ